MGKSTNIYSIGDLVSIDGLYEIREVRQNEFGEIDYVLQIGRNKVYTIPQEVLVRASLPSDFK